jgi:hypothetical protein
MLHEATAAAAAVEGVVLRTEEAVLAEVPG